MTVDTLLRGGSLADGTGASVRRADIAIARDRIVAVEPKLTIAANTIHDVSGLIVSPGFIDVHTHDDRLLLTDPAMTAKVSQGVTTVITGNCGLSLAPLTLTADPPSPLNLLGQRSDFGYPTFDHYVRALAERAPAVNVAALVGHSTLRVATLLDWRRSATPVEINSMRVALRAALEAGALGLSSGLYYPAGAGAKADELAALASELCAYRGVYTTHLRDEGARIFEAMEEAFDTAREAEVPLVISHHKCAHPDVWGRSKETLRKIESEAGRRKVALDVYPYDASSTALTAESANVSRKVLITDSEPYPEYAGRDLDEIAAERGCTRTEAADRLAPGGAIYFKMDEGDVRRILAHPLSMVASDGLPHQARPHPRLWGAFPRVLARYVRELQLLPLEEAVRKMTGLSAKVFGLRDRGEVRPGAMADLVVFDADAIVDRATFDEPCMAAGGIELVFVNGRLVWKAGAATGVRPGRFLGNPKWTAQHQ